MLDETLLEQLKSAFSPLENSIALVYIDNGHADQPELLAMLNDIASTSQKISVVKSESKSFSLASPEFYIVKNEKPTGIVFKGIPNGHEFTSLILAILHTDGKGKFPDTNLIQRIKNIKGPVHVKTYISLTCENCPDVVQALNQMALLHGNFTHEMVDGAYFQEEINALGIQGVPSVPTLRPWTPAEEALLGKMPDDELARKIGCSLQAVGSRRRRRGIPPCGVKRPVI